MSKNNSKNNSKRSNRFDPNKIPEVGGQVDKNYTPPIQVGSAIEVDVEPDVEVDVEPDVEVDVEPDVEVDVESEDIVYATVRKAVNAYSHSTAASGIATSFSAKQKVIVVERHGRWAFVELESDRFKRGYVFQSFLKFAK